MLYLLLFLGGLLLVGGFEIGHWRTNRRFDARLQNLLGSYREQRLTLFDLKRDFLDISTALSKSRYSKLDLDSAEFDGKPGKPFSKSEAKRLAFLKGSQPKKRTPHG